MYQKSALSDLRVLALVPSDQAGSRLSKYSFLHEELRQMALCGAELHTVSPHVRSDIEIDGITVHAIPRLLNAVHSAKSYLKFLPKTGKGIPRLSAPRYLMTIYSILEQQKIDVIYSPFLWPFNIAGVPAAEMLNVPVVVSLRGADVLVEPSIEYGCTLDRQQEKVISSTLRSATRIIGVSQAMIDRAVELGADCARTEVILKGVSTDHFGPGDRCDARRRLGLSNIPVILFVGNLIKRKGVDVLINACSKLQCNQSFQLIVCGDGPELHELQTLTNRLDLEEFVTFQGRVSRKAIPDYFRACDVFVLPSLAEGSGNVLVEAYATGRPVVGTGESGIVDYIDDGVTGFHFRKNDSDDLAEKLSRLLANQAMAATFGEAGFERVKNRHRYEFMIEQIFQCFQSAIRDVNYRLRDALASELVGSAPIG